VLRHASISGLLLWVLLGCDRDNANSTNTTPQPPPKPSLAVELSSITPLAPGRRTHVAPDGQGRLFWVQESDNAAANEVVFTISDATLPHATKLTSAAIIEALERASGAPIARGKAPSGTIHSLAAGPDGRLYFYFSGGRGKLLLAGLGAFDARTGDLQILADAPNLERISGLAGLSIARGTVLRSGDLLWLWLRHTDAYALLSLDPASATGAALRKPFDRVTSPTSERPDLHTSREHLLPAQTDNALLFWQAPESTSTAGQSPRRGLVWKIQPNGAAAVLRDTPELPAHPLPPALDQTGRLVFFIPNSRDAPPPAPSKPAPLQYPAVAILGQDPSTIVGKDRFEAPARVKVQDLAPERLCRDRSGWVTYDTHSGELLRLKLVER
jgi:hypothetical protein